ncbi:hypothetical protein DL771_001334 [Monosporascus sp. 5C6A]|nr:hypothetical protein DL771_001334 [Monosporascus sp. 5C6A]
MPPPAKTNFKTYEAQTRLLAAVIATNKGIKLDFRALAAHVGGDASPSSIDHRLRPIKQLAKMQVQCVNKEEDPGQLPVEKGEIHKLYGESTPAGLEWQFRDIKKIGKAQQDAVMNGESPAGVLGSRGRASTPRAGAGTAASTPGSRASKSSAAATPSTAATPGSRASKGAGARGSFASSLGNSQKRPRPARDASDDFESDDTDYDLKDGPDPDETPTGRKKPKHAAARGGAGDQQQQQQQQSTTAATTPSAGGNASSSTSAGGASIFGNGTGTASSGGFGSSGGGNKNTFIDLVDDDDDDEEEVAQDNAGAGGKMPVVKPELKTMSALADGAAAGDDDYGFGAGPSGYYGSFVDDGSFAIGSLPDGEA